MSSSGPITADGALRKSTGSWGGAAVSLRGRDRVVARHAHDLSRSRHRRVRPHGAAREQHTGRAQVRSVVAVLRLEHEVERAAGGGQREASRARGRRAGRRGSGSPPRPPARPRHRRRASPRAPGPGRRWCRRPARAEQRAGSPRAASDRREAIECEAGGAQHLVPKRSALLRVWERVGLEAHQSHRGPPVASLSTRSPIEVAGPGDRRAAPDLRGSGLLGEALNSRAGRECPTERPGGVMLSPGGTP